VLGEASFEDSTSKDGDDDLLTMQTCLISYYYFAMVILLNGMPFHTSMARHPKQQEKSANRTVIYGGGQSQPLYDSPELEDRMDIVTMMENQ
jgi:preprotein translocase subunit SecG